MTRTQSEFKTPRLPCDPAAELAIIEGALFPGGFDRAAAIVSAADFSTTGGSKIFAAMESLAGTGRPVSVSMIERALENDSDYPLIVRALDLLVPFTAECVTHFSKIVRELAHRRRVMALASLAADELSDVTVPIDEALAPLLKEIKYGR